MTSPTTVEVLKKARALLEQGWAPTNQGAICSAVLKACGSVLLSMDIIRMIRDALPFGAHSVSFWEEAPGRTQSEVLDLMDRAIALASEKEAGHVG